ncbi:unnamed protein product [Moneuplotes crassus]|uniref:Protein kinase domain-containing protein n=1 Tax=Euplotes crassus TaxID=5936 RepID=A0AAD1UJC7_EUPCR|nr:unnamed protein product [Moneuplotes crassus]
MNRNMIEIAPKTKFSSTLTKISSNKKSKQKSKLKYSFFKKVSMGKTGSQVALQTVMKQNNQNDTQDKTELFQSAVFEELGKSINQKPMIIEEREAKISTDDKNHHKIKVFKTMNKSKLNKNKSMEKTSKPKNERDDKIIHMDSTNNPTSMTKDNLLVSQSIFDQQESFLKEDRQENSQILEQQASVPSIRKPKKNKSTFNNKKQPESPKTRLKNLFDGKKEDNKDLCTLNEEEKLSTKPRTLDKPPQYSTIKPLSDAKSSLEFPLKVQENLEVLSKVLIAQEIEELKYYETLYYFNLSQRVIDRKFAYQGTIEYDDEKSDYKLIVGEHILYRYEIVDSLGKGSFGQVIKAFDHKHKRNVALKVIKNKKRFHIQGKVEVALLKKLNETDEKDRKNIVRMEHSFIFRGHLCIVFELLSINLYEYIKLNNFKGCKMPVIQRFAIQILLALAHCKKNKVIHCDLKPENILLKKLNKSGIKMIDFGSGCFSNKRIYTYIQSRFYRAPEIVLGLPYGREIDIWSFGCILCELHTGYPIFPCENEQELLLSIQEYLGVPSKDLLDKSSTKKKFYDSEGKPLTLVTHKDRNTVPNSKTIQKFLKTDNADFIDFIRCCLTWDPSDRMDCDDAFKHPWIGSFLEQMKPSNPS